MVYVCSSSSSSFCGSCISRRDVLGTEVFLIGLETGYRVHIRLFNSCSRLSAVISSLSLSNLSHISLSRRLSLYLSLSLYESNSLCSLSLSALSLESGTELGRFVCVDQSMKAYEHRPSFSWTDQAGASVGRCVVQEYWVHIGVLHTSHYKSDLSMVCTDTRLQSRTHDWVTDTRLSHDTHDYSHGHTITVTDTHDYSHRLINAHWVNEDRLSHEITRPESGWRVTEYTRCIFHGLTI